MSTQMISAVCGDCDKLEVVEVDCDQLDAYRGGELVQTAFPTLSPQAREVIIGANLVKRPFAAPHLCSTCWDEL